MSAPGPGRKVSSPWGPHKQPLVSPRRPSPSHRPPAPGQAGPESSRGAGLQWTTPHCPSAPHLQLRSPHVHLWGVCLPRRVGAEHHVDTP